MTSPPEIARLQGGPLAATAAPLDRNITFSSVPPRRYTRIILTNVDQPITAVRDIHNESIPLTTRTVRERRAALDTTILNETHAWIQLTDATTGQPLRGHTLWLHGAAHGRVQTNSDGVAVIERRDLYVTVSFAGETNSSRRVYYGPARTQIAFQPAPFNIYQLLSSLAGALVSIAAFLIFYLPVAYIRRGT